MGSKRGSGNIRRQAALGRHQADCGFALVNTSNFEVNDNFSVKNIFSHVWGRYRQGIDNNDSSRLIGNDVNAKNGFGIKPLPTTYPDELQLNGKLRIAKFVLGATYCEGSVTSNPVSPS